MFLDTETQSKIATFPSSQSSSTCMTFFGDTDISTINRPLSNSSMRSSASFSMFFLLSILTKRGDKCPLVLLRSEEHTSELQSRPHLVCRLLLEKKKKKK